MTVQPIDGWSISRLARAFEMDRATVRKRLVNVKPIGESASKTLAPYLEHKPADFLSRVHYWRGFLTRARYQA